MRRTVFATIALAFILPLTAQAQETPPPEHQLLNYMLGEWTHENGGLACERLVERFVQCSEEYAGASGNTISALNVWGFDTQEDVYTWHRFFSNGSIDTAAGWLHDNTWTFLFEGLAGSRVRTTLIDESPDAFSFKWERSVEGGPWEMYLEGRMTKVR